MNYHATSTPLLNSNKGGSLPASTRLTPNTRSPKYLIASPTCGTPLRRPLERGGSPLLNSTVNVSLYTNVQSPGLASRIVQYDRAQNGTHNKKFGSPGLFPIVHLYKQSLPVVSPKPKRVTVKIAPPDDLSMYDHVDHSIIMSENARITKIHEQPTNGTTRSVLDALKEISRKRIHSAAEFESTSLEDGNRKRNKRILETNQTPEFTNSTNKRAREESPTDSGSPSPNADKNTPKRYCSIDPITASFTSANLRFQELRNDSGKKVVEEYRDDLPESPLRKTQQVNVDTQTNVIDDQFEREIVETPPTKREIPLETTKIVEKSTETEVESPLFDPKPLEIIRRNKLAALLGAICGEVPILEKPQVLIDAPINNSFPITSILSNCTKIAKEPKHVTFDLPIPPPIVTPNPLMAITQTTTALIMPIPSTMVAPFRDTTATISTSLPPPPPSLVSVNSFTPSSTSSNITPPKIVGGFKFDLTVPIATQNALNFASAASVPTSAVSVNPTTSADVPKFAFPFISAKSNDLDTNKPQNLVTSLKSFALPIPSANLPNPNISFGTQQANTTSNSTFNFGNSPITTSKADPPPKSFTFNAISTPTTQLKEPNTTSSLPLFSSTSATTNMFLKPTVALSSSPFQTEPTNPLPGFGTTANSVGFPLQGSTKFDIANSNNIFAATTANTNSTTPSATFSFGGGNNVVPLASSINFGGTVEKVGPSFAAPAVTTSTNNIFGSLPFGSAPAVSTNSNSTFVGFGSGIKESPQASIKFGETAVKTVAISPPTTTTHLFSFGGSTATDIQKPFNQLKDNSAPNGFGSSPKLTFGNFSTNSFGTEVPPNQTFSFGGNVNTFGGPPPANANFNKPANFEATFGGQQFNAPATFAAQQTKLFSFGAATAIPKAADPLASVDVKPSSVFAFGTPTVVKPQPTSAGGGGFNFSPGAGFGAANAAPAPVMFGSPQITPAFNVGGFNAPAMVGSPGMFSIGSGSSSGPSRPRTQLKTKRRT